MTRVHRAAVEGYTARAGTYVTGRPEYPAEVNGWLREELGLGAGRTVVDLGAGTGKFTSRLLATGAAVVAVEPVAAMREQLLLRCAGVTAVEGTAERIPLADESVDAVVCAQSFHWFATKAAVEEIRRVLRPGGALGLIWNVRDESVAWVAALTRIIEPYGGDAPRYWRQEWRRVFPAEGFGTLRERHFLNGHRGSPEQVIVDRTLSVSFIAALPREEQERVEAAVRGLIAGTAELAGRDTVTFPYETVAYWCAKVDSAKRG